MALCFYFFFFKQKTAYEMRISDWSSDVCSSDLKTVAYVHMLKRDVLFAAVVVDAPRCLRGQPEQRLYRRSGLAAGAQLQQLAEQRQRDDDSCRLEIDPYPSVLAERRWK